MLCMSLFVGMSLSFAANWCLDVVVVCCHLVFGSRCRLLPPHLVFGHSVWLLPPDICLVFGCFVLGRWYLVFFGHPRYTFQCWARVGQPSKANHEGKKRLTKTWRRRRGDTRQKCAGKCCTLTSLLPEMVEYFPRPNPMNFFFSML